MKPTIKITKASEREFTRTLRKYLEYSSKTLPQALNEKAAFILSGGDDTQGAIKLTHKADAEKIRRELGVETQTRVSKSGRVRRTNKFLGNYSDSLAVKIVIARLRRAGEKIPNSAELQKKARKMIAGRTFATGFIRSGWLPALKRLRRFSKYAKESIGLAGKPVGQPKGGVSVASPSQGLSSRVRFWNSAGGDKKHRGALMKYASSALEQAFRAETASMKGYIERKMKEGARKLGIRVR